LRIQHARGRHVFFVDGRQFSWADASGIDIAERGDDVLSLATAMVIDLVCHPESKND
jgi:hypothetical protein